MCAPFSCHQNFLWGFMGFPALPLLSSYPFASSLKSIQRGLYFPLSRPPVSTSATSMPDWSSNPFLFYDCWQMPNLPFLLVEFYQCFPARDRFQFFHAGGAFSSEMLVVFLPMVVPTLGFISMCFFGAAPPFFFSEWVQAASRRTPPRMLP